MAMGWGNKYGGGVINLYTYMYKSAKTDWLQIYLVDFTKNWWISLLIKYANDTLSIKL